MNPQQLGGLIRVLMSGLGFIAMKYGMDEATWNGLTDAMVTFGGAALTIGTLAWSYYSNSTRSVVMQSADSHEVKEIVTDAPLANSIESGKVVPVDEGRTVQ